MLISERLKAARKKCKLTQQQVADLLKLDRSTYSYYELGTINPSIEALKTLTAIYKVDMDWLVGNERSDQALHECESEIEKMKAVKEKHMADLSKDERRFIALLRAAQAIDRDADIYASLFSLVFDSQDEDDE